MSDTYALSLPIGILSHVPGKTATLRDYAEPSNPELDASIRSGDYFITLATMLEAIAADLPELSIATNSLALTRLARDLDYIQRHYAIVKKNRPDKLTELH